MAFKKKYKKPFKKKDDGLTDEERIQQEVMRTRMPKGKETIGFVEQLLGSKRMYVQCKDGKRRLCRVPGRCAKFVWVREGDYVIIEPWEIQGDERGDVIWKYRRHQVEYLRRKGVLEGI